MKAQELIQKMRDGGYNETADILEKRTKNNPTTLFISDLDDEAFACEVDTSLVSWLMQNCTWFNNNIRKGFTVCFK